MTVANGVMIFRNSKHEKTTVLQVTTLSAVQPINEMPTTKQLTDHFNKPVRSKTSDVEISNKQNIKLINQPKNIMIDKQITNKQ